MINCPHCGASNKDGSKFCGDCGQPLITRNGVTCPMCDNLNPPSVTACTNCGARLIPVGVTPSEEPLELLEVEEGAVVEGVKGEDTVAEPDDRGESESLEEFADVSEAEPEEAMPPWLEKLRELPSEEAASEEEATRLAPGELPDWLEVPPEFEEVLSAAGRAVEEEGVPRAEIPSWLEALRPAEEEGVAEPGELGGPPERTGLLKGIRGTLGIEPILAIPPRAASLPAFSAPPHAYEHAEVFDKVVREPARPSAEVVRPRSLETLVASTMRWIIYLIVATAVVVPILLGSNWAEANMPVTASTIAMYDAIEDLPADSVVLVSHDYDPGVAGEMIPQAKAVVGHLMRRQVRLINVSLTPEGARLSREVVDEVAEAHGYEYGDDYLSLGYVVGVEAGLRSIVEGFGGPGGTDFVDRIEDVALVVEFAGAPEYVRLWLEQVQAPYGVPMVAGVSATADPFARPYYRNQAQHQLLGLMTGLVGAAEYERRAGHPGLALASMDSQSMAHIAIVLLVLVGNLAYLGGRLRGK